MIAKDLEAENRPRAEHVLFRFEKSLGRSIRDNAEEFSSIPTTIIEQILRESGQETQDFTTIDEVVEAAYLNTLFDLAVTSARTEEYSRNFRSLKLWCENIGVFSIRNIIAHPNRKWLDHYWVVIQCLATHPLIIELELREVREALDAALQGKFEAPPDAWRKAVAAMEIQNNLSKSTRSSEHGKFVGRRKERQKLKKLVLGGRVAAISIIAPGGLGKTALLLSCLRELARNHKAMQNFDSIFFLSAKRQLLTAEGVKTIKPDLDGLDSLGMQIAKGILEDSMATWNQLIEVHGDRRIVLCLDNVEDLILEERDAIEDLLLNEFPRNWIVILTSRIPVNHTSAINLSKMEYEDAQALTHCYAEEAGIKFKGENDAAEIAKLAESPLAIRIAIDLIRSGANFSDVSRNATTLTGNFAYAKLVGALPEDTRKILEALYTIDRPVKPTVLSMVLEWDVVRTRVAMVDAERLSLINTSDLKPVGLLLRVSLREYMRENIDDNYRDFRNSVLSRSDRLIADETIYSNVADYDVDSTNYEQNLDDVQDNELRTRLRLILAGLGTTGFNSTKVLNELTYLGTIYTEVSAVDRICGLVWRSKDEQVEFRRALENAIAKNSNDWCAALILSESYRDVNMYDLAKKHCQRFLDPQITLGGAVRARFLSLYYTSEIWRASDRIRNGVDVAQAHSDLADVIRETSSWKDKDEKDVELVETWAGLHAMALRRSVEWSGAHTQTRMDTLKKALDVYRWLYTESNGVTGRARLELQQLAEQFLYAYRSPEGANFVGDVQSFVQFLAENLESLLVAAPERKAGRWRWLMNQFRVIDRGRLVEKVPKESWDRWGIGEPVVSEDDGMIQVTIYHNPPNRFFLFAEDGGRQQYFVHGTKTQMSQHELDGLGLGEVLWVRPGEPDKKHSAISVLEARTRE